MNTRKSLLEFMQINRMSDWHEPDEQEVNAFVTGDHLDNAFGNSPAAFNKELVLHLTVDGNEIVSFNIADLLDAITEGGIYYDHHSRTYKIN